MMFVITFMNGQLLAGVADWLLTYIIHSTLLLGAAALVTAKIIRTNAWRETIWKTALVGGILTTTLQLGLGFQPVTGEWSVPIGIAAATEDAKLVDSAAGTDPGAGSESAPAASPTDKTASTVITKAEEIHERALLPAGRTAESSARMEGSPGSISKISGERNVGSGAPATTDIVQSPANSQGSREAGGVNWLVVLQIGRAHV